MRFSNMFDDSGNVIDKIGQKKRRYFFNNINISGSIPIRVNGDREVSVLYFKPHTHDSYSCEYRYFSNVFGEYLIVYFNLVDSIWGYRNSITVLVYRDNGNRVEHVKLKASIDNIDLNYIERLIEEQLYTHNMMRNSYASTAYDPVYVRAHWSDSNDYETKKDKKETILEKLRKEAKDFCKDVFKF